MSSPTYALSILKKIWFKVFLLNLFSCILSYYAYGLETKSNQLTYPISTTQAVQNIPSITYEFIPIEEDNEKINIKISFYGSGSKHMREGKLKYTLLTFLYDPLLTEPQDIDKLSLKLEGARVIGHAAISKESLAKNLAKEDLETLLAFNKNSKDIGLWVILEHLAGEKISVQYQAEISHEEHDDVIVYKMRGSALGIPMLLLDKSQELQVILDWHKVAKNHEYMLSDILGHSKNEVQIGSVKNEIHITYGDYILAVKK